MPIVSATLRFRACGCRVTRSECLREVRRVDEWTKQKIAPGDLRVDEFLEQFEFARVTEEMSHVFDAMDRDNGVLIFIGLRKQRIVLLLACCTRSSHPQGHCQGRPRQAFWPSWDRTQATNFASDHLRSKSGGGKATSIGLPKPALRLVCSEHCPDAGGH